MNWSDREAVSLILESSLSTQMWKQCIERSFICLLLQDEIFHSVYLFLVIIPCIFSQISKGKPSSKWLQFAALPMLPKAHKKTKPTAQLSTVELVSIKIRVLRPIFTAFWWLKS